MSVDETSCVSEVAGTMLSMVGATDRARHIVGRFHSVLPTIKPADVVAELRVRCGSIPQFSADVVEWSEVRQRPEGRGALYRINPGQGGNPHYFVVSDRKVWRVV